MERLPLPFGVGMDLASIVQEDGPELRPPRRLSGGGGGGQCWRHGWSPCQPGSLAFQRVDKSDAGGRACQLLSQCALLAQLDGRQRSARQPPCALCSLRRPGSSRSFQRRVRDVAGPSAGEGLASDGHHNRPDASRRDAPLQRRVGAGPHESYSVQEGTVTHLPPHACFCSY